MNIWSVLFEIGLVSKLSRLGLVQKFRFAWKFGLVW